MKVEEKTMNLGDKLYELRKSKNLTQDDVSEKLNVTRQTVSKWETNQSTPDFDKIIPLCELYEISPNELLTGEKQEKDQEQQYQNQKQSQTQEQVHEGTNGTTNNKDSEEFSWDEAKKHLFTREKEDDEDNYSNMTKNQIKQKSAEVVSSSILLFFVAIAFAGIGVTVMRWNPVVVGCTFLVLVGIGVVRIVKHYMSIPQLETTKEEEKRNKIVKQIHDIIGGIAVAIYFIVSFTTMAWHITWIIFIIAAMLGQIVNLIFMLKEDDENEK